MISMNPKQVTFSGKRTEEMVTARAMIEVLERAIDWLRSLDPESSVEWEVVSVNIGQKIKMIFRNPSVNGAVADSLDTLSTLQGKRKPRMTPHLSDEIIEQTIQLGKAAGHGFASIRISSPGAHTVRVTPDLVRRVEALAKPVFMRTEWTTLQGVMDQVTVDAATGKSRFRITHPLTGEDITCNFDPSNIYLEEVKKALPHRVLVHGRARLGKRGQVVSIDVTTLKQLRESGFDPIEKTPGIDITGGMDSTDYVERVRSGNA